MKEKIEEKSRFFIRTQYFLDLIGLKRQSPLLTVYMLIVLKVYINIVCEFKTQTNYDSPCVVRGRSYDFTIRTLEVRPPMVVLFAFLHTDHSL